MKLLEVLQGLDYEVLKGNTDTEIREIQNDSRKVQLGDLFFCISGAVSDGHTYAEDVAAKGAAVIVVEKPVNVPDTVTVIRVKSTRYAMGKISSAFYGNPSEKLTVIGLTGTKGKTTTTYMIREMLERSGIKTGLIGTIEIIDGNQKIHANNTTPESMILHKYSVSSKKLSSRITRSILSFAVHPPYFTIRILLYTVKRVSVARYPL